VVQRQLWLLQNIADITVTESYDIARKEFYALRRREATARRIAVEEAEMLGADFGPSDMSKAVTIESKMYNDWEAWADKMNMENDAKNASFSGQQMSVERQALEETRQVEQNSAKGRPAPMNSSRIGGVIGAEVFQREAQKREMRNVR
jgi:small subunit ribosomal protein S23